MIAESPSLLLRRRGVLLRGQITESSATDCIAQLLWLAHESGQLPATIYVDSPGGSVTASLAIIHTMNNLPFPLATHCCGAAGGTAAAVVAHGRRGWRSATPEAQFAFSPVFADPARGYVEAELSQFDTVLCEMISEDTNRHEAEIASLFASHAALSAAGALELGLIDSIASVPPKPAARRASAFSMKERFKKVLGWWRVCLSAG